MTLSLFLQPLLAFALVSSAQTPAPQKNITPTQPAACPCASCVTVSLSCTQVKPPSPPRPPRPKACRDGDKARCELETGRAYLEYDFWTEAIQHCGIALKADKWRDAAKECIGDAKAGLTKEKDALAKERDDARNRRREAIDARLTVIRELTDRSVFVSAEAEITELRRHLHDDDAKLGPVEKSDEESIDKAAEKLAKRRYSWWNRVRTGWGPFWGGLPDAFLLTLKLAWWAVIAFVIYECLYSWRKSVRQEKWNWLSDSNPDKYKSRYIDWIVASVEDHTGQLAAGAVMDALNVDHNPLFQKLGNSSLLALPPSLLPVNDENDQSEMEMTVLRDFLFETQENPPKIRQDLSTLFEALDKPLFGRHRFKQADAFDELTTVKLGIVEGSLGGLLRTFEKWWTKGWPTIRGSVTIEKFGETSFASVRLVCNFDLRRPKNYVELPENSGPVKINELFGTEKTLAVYASTQMEQYTDAVDLAAQRAAFRLLYRLVMRTEQPNLAIAASSYRQGERLFMTAL